MVKNCRCAFYDATTSKWYELLEFKVNNGRFSTLVYSENSFSISDISKFVIPGFIDAHVHLLEDPYTVEGSDSIYHQPFDKLWMRAERNMRDALKGGITSLKDLGGRQYASLALKRRHELSKQGYPRLYTSGCYFSKPGGHGANRGAIIVYDMENYHDHLLLLKRAGVDFVKILHAEGIFSLDELSKMVGLAHGYEMIVSIHAYHNGTAMDAVMAGADILEHAGDYSDELLDLIVQKETIIVPTYISACDSNEENCKGLGEDINIEILKKWLDDEKKVIPKLFQKGIQVALGTDACLPGTVCNSLGREISSLHTDFGIGIETLMYSANMITPKALGMDGELGKIEVGYFADYLCYDTNPLENIECMPFPKEVWVHGKRVEY